MQLRAHVRTLCPVRDSVFSLAGLLAGPPLPAPHPVQVSTGYGLSFLTPLKMNRLCMPTLQPKELRELSEAIKEGYYYEFFIDDLPAEGCVLLFLFLFVGCVVPYLYFELA